MNGCHTQHCNRFQPVAEKKTEKSQTTRRQSLTTYPLSAREKYVIVVMGGRQGAKYGKFRAGRRVNMTWVDARRQGSVQNIVVELLETKTFTANIGKQHLSNQQVLISMQGKRQISEMHRYR